MKYGGYMGKVLKIDLTTRETSEYPWSDRERELYLGGKIMAAKILYDNIGPDVQALSPENYLVITTGPLSGTGAPSSSRFNISGVSPLTGLIASSNCGGNFGLNLKKAGYDGLIICGKSMEKVWIEITEEKVSFNNADMLWGKNTNETQALLGDKKGKIVIGPAGENLVKYAGVFSEERAAGRAGLGAVMGAKNLKAVVVSGIQKVNVANEVKTREFYRKWIASLRKHPITGTQLPKFGTAGLVSIMNAKKVLATRNFKYGRFKDFEMVSGEVLAEKHLIKNKGCITCPIQCGRQVEVEGRKVKGPELETLGLLGPNIENNNLELIIKWNLKLDELGMDTISTAGTIAFCMELNEKGLWNNGLEFGKTDNLEHIFEDIAHRRGIGNELAEGVKYLSERYGGKEFAIHSKGLELSAYEPRSAIGQGLGYATSNRGGCHLNAGYVIIFEALALSMDPYSKKNKAELTIMCQDLMEAVSASGICLFTLYGMIPEYLVTHPNSLVTRTANKVLATSATAGAVSLVDGASEGAFPVNLSILPHSNALSLATGMKMDFGRMRIIGERGFNLERMFNVRRGLTSEMDSLPKRLTHELQDPRDSRTKVPLEELKKRYYSVRGWDEQGVPKEKNLKRLGLAGEKKWLQSDFSVPQDL